MPGTPSTAFYSTQFEDYFDALAVCLSHLLDDTRSAFAVRTLKVRELNDCDRARCSVLLSHEGNNSVRLRSGAAVP